MATSATPVLQNGPWGGSGGGTPVDLTLRRFDLAMSVRARWEDVFDDCISYTLPHADRMRSGTDGESKTTRIYDSTAVSALSDFASRLQSYVCPIGAEWASIKSGPAVPADRRPDIDRELRRVQDTVFDIIRNSNFDMQLSEALHHYGIGTACLLVEPGTATRPIEFTAIPLNELVLENSAFGSPTGIFRQRRIRNRDLPFFFPNPTIPIQGLGRINRDPDGQTTVIEACLRQPTRQEEVWDHQVIFLEDRAIIDRELYVGVGSCPYLPFHWSKAAGDTYGRGPVMNVIGAIRVLNTIVEMMLEHADVQIAGMWQADDDGVINPETIRFYGGAVVPRAPGSSGLEPLTPGGKIEWISLGVEQMRGEIKRALFDEPLGNMQQDARIQTAQEVVERVADLSRRVGSSFGRLQAEMVQPLIRRILYILRRQGRIRMPTLSSRVVEVSMNSPIGRTQGTSEVVAIQRLNQVLAEMFGPGAANLIIKKADVSEALADRLGVPLTLINSPSEVAAIEQQMQRQQMLLEMLKGAGVPEGQAGLL